MSTPKAVKDFIQRRKDNNLCISCGNPLDRNGVNCIDCNNKKNEEYRKTKQAYIDCGICYRCRKNPIMGVEKMCPECRAKLATWKASFPRQAISFSRTIPSVFKRTSIAVSSSMEIPAQTISFPFVEKPA